MSQVSRCIVASLTFKASILQPEMEAVSLLGIGQWIPHCNAALRPGFLEPGKMRKEEKIDRKEENKGRRDKERKKIE